MAPHVGWALIAFGAILVASHRPLGVLLARSQPRWMRPWKGAARGSGTIVLLIGIALLVAGALEVADIVGFATGAR